jgi:hypothetical protein
LLVLWLADATAGGLNLAPGLFVIGVGVGVMLTSSVNVVQSSVPEKDQGEISGVSRSISNLGSSLGTSVVGAVLVSAIITGIGSQTAESTVLNPTQKEQVAVALEGDVSAVSDTQVRTALEGQPQDVVDEVTRINASARNRGLGLALVAVVVVSLLGLLAALLLPSQLPSATASVPVTEPLPDQSESAPTPR